VTATTGEPLAGAIITLVGPRGDEARHVIAGDDGSFALSHLGEGTYTLVAAAPNFRAAASMVAVRSEEAEARLSLVAIGSLAGKVTQVNDGSPVAADLELLNPEGSLALTGHTGRDGSFVLADVLEGHYELVVRSTAHRSETLPVVVKRGGTQVADVVLTGVGYVYGAVSGVDGAWLPGVWVTLAGTSGAIMAETSTDGAGSYQFPDVTEGRYTVAVAPGQSGAKWEARPTVASRRLDIVAGKVVAADLTLEAG
jgi:hypothetical protein